MDREAGLIGMEVFHTRHVALNLDAALGWLRLEGSVAVLSLCGFPLHLVALKLRLQFMCCSFVREK